MEEEVGAEAGMDEKEVELLFSVEESIRRWKGDGG